uniref:Oxidoreductase n=1 Tax=Heterorhabditis bacteriophora TaxID=37862 RepID=A0A1I7XDW8_HETBA
MCPHQLVADWQVGSKQTHAIIFPFAIHALVSTCTGQLDPKGKMFQAKDFGEIACE